MSARPREYLKPNRPDLERFVNVLLPYADEGTFTSLRSFTHGGGGKPFAIKAVRINGSLDAVTDAAESMAERSANAREPVVFAPPVATFRNAEHAGEADLANGVAL